MRLKALPQVFYQPIRSAPVELSPQAEERPRWLSCFQTLLEHGLSAQDAAHALGCPAPH